MGTDSKLNTAYRMIGMFIVALIPFALELSAVAALWQMLDRNMALLNALTVMTVLIIIEKLWSLAWKLTKWMAEWL